MAFSLFCTAPHQYLYAVFGHCGLGRHILDSNSSEHNSTVEEATHEDGNGESVDVIESEDVLEVEAVSVESTEPTKTKKKSKAKKPSKKKSSKSDDES